MIRVRFCGPATTRSIASSSAASSISLESRRAVSSAASLSTLARSAPVKPGVRRAPARRSTSVARGWARARPPGEGEKSDVGREGLAPAVDLEDAVAADHVGGVDRDLPVEPAGAQQRRVQDVGAVGRGDEDDVGLDVEAVHLNQQLVEGLLALVVPSAQAGATVAADRVDLVDEDDGGCVVLGLLE